jgi:hypothetical protein
MHEDQGNMCCIILQYDRNLPVGIDEQSESTSGQIILGVDIDHHT